MPPKGFSLNNDAMGTAHPKAFNASKALHKLHRLQDSGQLDQASAYADTLVAGDSPAVHEPSLIIAILNLYERLGRSDHGFHLLDKGIISHPSHEGLRELRSRLFAQQSFWTKAIQSWYGWFPLSTSSPLQLEEILASYVKQSSDYFRLHLYLEGALVCCRYLALRTDNADIWSNLGIFQTRLGHFQSSEQSLKRSLQLQPERSSVWNSLGNLYSKTARHDQAINAFHKSIEFDPSNPNPWSNLANEHHIRAELDDAYRCSAKALSLQPSAKPSFDHFTRMRRVCDLEGIASCDWLAAALTMPVNTIPYSSLNLLTLAESHEHHLQLRQIFQRWADWAQTPAHQSPLSEPLTARRGSHGALIRIGLLSADLRHHSVTKFVRPLIDYLDRNQFALEAFSCYPAPSDPVQAQLRQQIPHFHDVERLSLRELAAFIRRRSIDVLVDLTGFTNHNRAGVVAYRPAPVQIGWLGYPGTTSLADLDYLLLDKYLAPTSQDYLREKPLIMDGSSVCFGTMTDVPINPLLPFQRNGYITFGSLNNSYKLTRLTFDLWAQVMLRLPDSRLVFYRREFESTLLRSNVLEEFKARSIDPDRITMINNRSTQRHYLDCYNDIDLSMDTFPVVGGTTTCDALWMGVPVIALEGTNIHQRVCSAILHNLDCPELVASSPTDFVEKSFNLASDPYRLVSYRTSLRERMRNSVLCDGRAFATNFQNAILSALHNL